MLIGTYLQSFIKIGSVTILYMVKGWMSLYYVPRNSIFQIKMNQVEQCKMIIILSIHPIKVKDRSREFCSKYQELIVIMIVSLSSFLLINLSLTKPKHLIMVKLLLAGFGRINQRNL